MTKERLTIDLLTTRELGFVSDPDLRIIIEDLLDEIERVFSVSGFRSALYLSISAVEGILKHAIKLNSEKANNSISKLKIKTKCGAPKKKKDLNLFECISVCDDIKLIPQDLKATYDQMRQFRNYIHPERELSSANKINIGISEIGIGILNATLLHFDKLRFIEGGTWKVVSGNPQYTLSNQQLILPGNGFPQHSFHSCLVTDHFKNRNFNLELTVNVPDGAMLNFLYNFTGEDDFRMIRIDKRKSRDKTKPLDDGLFYCSEKLRWPKISGFEASPDINQNSHKLLIEVSGNSLKFSVDGTELKPATGAWDYDPDKQIGFFNQIHQVKVENFMLNIT